MADKDELFEHDYDGIQEYDNSLPRWWLWLFWLTIIFSGFYWIYYHIAHAGPSQVEVLALQMKQQEALEMQRAAAREKAGESELLALASKPEVLKAGSAVFASKCLPCHLDRGQGLVGPNLTDDYWIHGGGIKDIRNTVTNGVIAKGMLAWKGLLTEEEIDAVSAFVWSLHGTNPPNPKAAEGQFVKRD